MSYGTICRARSNRQTCLINMLMCQISLGNMFPWSLDWKIPSFLVFSNWERNALIYGMRKSRKSCDLKKEKICLRSHLVHSTIIICLSALSWLKANFWYFRGTTFNLIHGQIARKDFPQSTQRTFSCISFSNWRSTVQDRNWLPDVLDAEGVVFPLTSREIVEAAKNIRWYLETFLLYEIYISGILETTEKKQLETNCFR